MSGRPQINFEEVKRDVLVLLHSRFLADLGAIRPTEAANECGRPYNFVRMILRELKTGGLCREDYDGADHEVIPGIGAFVGSYRRYVSPDDRLIEITRAGIEWINKIDDASYHDALARLGHPASEYALIPASDRTVTLGHNQPDYQEAVIALDKVIEAFRNDHRLDNEWGHEKGALLKALEGGRELLSDTVVQVRIGMALLLEPLHRLVQKYEKELVGALASTALALVAKLLGLG